MGKKKRNRANRARPSGGSHRHPGGQNRPHPETRSGQLTSPVTARTQSGAGDQTGNAAAQLQVMVGLITTGTVMGWAHQNAIVHLDHATGRSPGGEIRCPPLGLRRLVT